MKNTQDRNSDWWVCKPISLKTALLHSLQNYGMITSEVKSMRDFPVFPTRHGVASVILKQIPYQKAAYITIRDSKEPELLLKECSDFCRACGAERIYSTGHECLEQYPLYTSLWQMACPWSVIEDTDAALWPVQEKTLEIWRTIYNQKVSGVPTGAWMSEADGMQMLQKADGYFVHRAGKLLGIGRACGERIDWVAGVEPGGGRETVMALKHVLHTDVINLTAASANEKAVKLYESMGFVKTRELVRWYCVSAK